VKSLQGTLPKARIQMANSIKLDLEKNKLRLEFYKARNQQQPSPLHSKWVEIYSDRVKKLERQLTKAQRAASLN
jgi:hypothetical protein